jgi:hypothetical protein
MILTSHDTSSCVDVSGQHNVGVSQHGALKLPGLEEVSDIGNGEKACFPIAGLNQPTTFGRLCGFLSILLVGSDER